MTAANGSTLQCQRLTVSVPGRLLVDALDLTVGAGEFLAVLGRNGAGKSLTLHTMAGLRTPQGGAVLLDGQPVGTRRRYVARHLGVLPQHTDDIFPASVLDTVLTGRHPHIGRLQWESDEDRRIAMDSLRMTGLAEIVGRDVATLSGGERRRLAVAQVLTQAPGLFLLDEPTNHLDPQHQLDVLRIFSDKTREGAAVIACLHDVNLAARFASRCLLLFGDGRWELGDCDAVLEESRLSELYATRIELVPWRNRSLFVATDGQDEVNAARR